MNLNPHICTITEQSSNSGLPPLKRNASWMKKLVRHLKKFCMVSDRDSRIIEFFKTKTGLLEEKRRQGRQYSYMIHPFSLCNMTREIVMVFVFCSTFVFLPYKFSFTPTTVLGGNPENCILLGANILYIADIIIRFFTGVIEKQSKLIILDRKIVARRYITSPYFICDVLSSIPVELFAIIYNTSTIVFLISFLRLLKLARLPTFLKYLQRAIAFIGWNKPSLHFIRYALIITLMVHWAICANALLVYVQEHGLSHSVILQSSYRGIMYETSGLLLCARARNIETFVENARAASNKLEILTFSYLLDTRPADLIMDMCVMIAGKLLSTATGVVIISTVFESKALETKYQSIISQLKEYMKNKKLPLTMRDRLLQYYEHRFQGKYFKERAISALLSENIHKEVNMNVCKQLVKSVNIFADLPPSVLSNVLSHLKPEVYLPNDLIIKSGSLGDCMYFLASGTVAVYTPSGREICHLQDGAYFGEISLILKNSKRTTDIIAIEVCEVFRLDKKAFRLCFKFDKYGIFEKMQATAEQRLRQTATLEESYKLELFQLLYTDKN